MKPKAKLKITVLKKPITRKLDCWVAMEYDAKLIFKGVTWYRPKGGFGGRGDREDWVADLPGGSVSVCDYMWVKRLRWGFHFYPSFAKALEGQMREGLMWMRHDLVKVKRESALKIANLSTSIALLQRQLATPKQNRKKGKK